ncbi:MAG: hypothetical protein JSV33_05635 [bacterium]|nr:MAG: hypothetical protein JSV33_05635 [bacterium]
MRMCIRSLYPVMVVTVTLAMAVVPGCVFNYEAENVPSYCQIASHRCGAACAQMLIQYSCDRQSPPVVPDWYGPLEFNQIYIYGWIEEYQTGRGIPEPYKYPEAVKEAILGLKVAPAHFILVHGPDKAEVMHEMLYWMKKSDYPSATMKGGGHWVLPYKYETDTEPEPGNTVTLNSISVYDPACFPCSDPGSGALIVDDISSEGWDASYWNQGVSFWSGQPLHGEYVAIVEPPESRGMVKIKKAYIGSKQEILTVGEAVKRAGAYVRERKLAGRKVLSFLADAMPQTAFLVERPDRNMHYYLIPFVSGKAEPARAVMIINAYNGNFFECGYLCGPLRYIAKTDAVKVALEKAGIERYETAAATLKFVDSNISSSHYYPFWEVIVDSETFYVDMQMNLHRELKLHRMEP